MWHFAVQVFWACIVPLTVGYVLEGHQRADFAQQAARQAASARGAAASINRHQGADPAAASSSAHGSHGEGWQAGPSRDLSVAGPSAPPFAVDYSEPQSDARSPSDEDLASPVAADLLIAAAVLPVVGAAQWQLMRLCISWHGGLVSQVLPT